MVSGRGSSLRIISCDMRSPNSGTRDHPPHTEVTR